MTGKDKGKGKPKAKEIPQAQEKQASPQPESQPNEAHSNPFIEIPHKRMRALKKRLVRIEKNEEAKSKGVTLDADQIRSIEQKQEVLDILHELEDLIKFMTVVESEEAAKAAKLKKQQEQDEQKKISDAKVQSHQEFKKALDLVFILNVFANEGVRMLFTSGGVDGFVLSVEELNQLDTIAFVLYGQYNPAAGLVVSSKGFHDRLFKLSSRSSEAISAGFTYANAHELLTKISLSSFFDPALAAKLAEERAIAQAAAEAALREQEEMQRSYEIISYEEVPVPSHMSPEQMNGLPGGKPLAFFGESELLGGMRPKLSFDGSPEVIVPIPQTLFDHQVRLPAAPVSASTPAASQPQNSTPEHAQPSEAIAVAQALETPAPLVEGSHRGHGRGASRGTRGGRGGYDRNQPRHERRPHDDRSGDNRNFERQRTNNHRDDGGFQRKGGYSRGGHRDGGAQ